jgi:hypothetical protein
MIAFDASTINNKFELEHSAINNLPSGEKLQ